MSFQRLSLPIILVLAGSFLSACSDRDLGDDFELLPGTEAVMLGPSSISISPDGQFMAVLNDSIVYGCPDRWRRFGIVTMNLHTGALRQHRLASDMDEKTKKEIRKYIRNYGLVDEFQQDSWRDGMFFVYAGSKGCLRVDPHSDEIEVGRWSCFEGLSSSGHVPRGYLLEIEQKYDDRGLLPYEGRYHPSRMNGWTQLGKLSMPTSCEEDSAVLYVVDRDHRRVYRIDGKTCTSVFRAPGRLTNPGITQIKVSPDGRYLAVLREKKVALPVPVLSSGNELYLLDLRNKGRRFKWSAGAIESCAWSPDSQEVYVTSDARGEGVYRLRLSDLGR